MTRFETTRIDYSKPLSHKPAGLNLKTPFKLIGSVCGLVALSVVMANTGDDETSPARSPHIDDTQTSAAPPAEWPTPATSRPAQSARPGIIQREPPRQLAMLDDTMLDDTGDLSPTPLPSSLPARIPHSLDEVSRAPEIEWRSAEVRRGDNLSLIGERHGVGASVIYKLMAAGEETKHLKRIRPGERIDLAFGADKQLKKLRYRIDEETLLLVEADAEGFTSRLQTETLERRIQRASGTVNHSLFLAAQNANLPQSVIMELAGIFGWDVDFALDVRSGDRFAVVYEAWYRDGEKVRDGRILSAEYVNQGRTHRAAWYQPAEGRGDYYTPDGRTLRKAFLRNPVDIVRITSHFNLRRKHPILHKIRAHRGVDYGAPTGTPVRATGDGKVVHRGSKGGYGRTVVLRHGSKYSSLYAHLSRYARGLKNGSRVKQGQVIGYVGASGLASGPHLHYEFLVNGTHRNPLKVDLPGVEPLAKHHFDDFVAQTAGLFAELDALRAKRLAANP